MGEKGSISITALKFKQLAQEVDRMRSQMDVNRFDLGFTEEQLAMLDKPTRLGFTGEQMEVLHRRIQDLEQQMIVALGGTRTVEINK